MALVTLPGLVAAADKVILDGEVDEIAHCPVTGDLIGITHGGKIVVIDKSTGALSDMAATIGTDGSIGFYFNSKVDAVRAVSTDGVNLVSFPVGFGNIDAPANFVLRFTALAYAAGDVNEGAKPAIYANAYTCTYTVNGAVQQTTDLDGSFAGFAAMLPAM